MRPVLSAESHDQVTLRIPLDYTEWTTINLLESIENGYCVCAAAFNPKYSGTIEEHIEDTG